jgi:regulator of replication initiation timing
MAKAAGKKAAPKKKTAADDKKYLCPYCMKEKKKTDFYVSSDPMVLTGITIMCKDCARKIAMNWDDHRQEFGTCTKASIQEALIRLDKPFLNRIWDASYMEWASQKEQLRRTTIWDAYIKNIGLTQYRGLRWQDSDIFDVYVEKAKQAAKIELGKENRPSNINAEDVQEAYKTNRKDAIRMIGYDPFANYPIEDDKPVLYAQLISFIDEETKNDGMKMNAVIQIVKAFNQIQKINDAIDELSSDVMSLNNNNGTIKQHADTISKLLSGANALAKDNGISVNFNNSKSKGQNTLTGKMKELELIGFRDAKINMYDIDYCKGMQQVAEISAKAQVDQIGFDENVVNEIGNIRRELVDSLQKDRDKAVERARKLLVENKDLKEFLREKDLIDEFGQVIDND